MSRLVDETNNENKGCLDSGETLSNQNPINEFLKSQNRNLKGLTEEEFVASYESHMKKSTKVDSEGNEDSKFESAPTLESNSIPDKNVSEFASSNTKSSESIRSTVPKFSIGVQLDSIVLKFTTFSESCKEAPSFTVDHEGASIGRDVSNKINVPSDARLANDSHAAIEYHKGSFYIIDGGQEFSASIRIGLRGNHQKVWVLEKDSRFSVGNSIFATIGVDPNDGSLMIEAIEGPLRGEKKTINKNIGATIGRSSENQISVPDRELSRKHSKIEFDEKISKYILCDIGSTNGTYMQLNGPYGGRFKLNINDHILVGRTGLSINRFDYGISEEMGHRQTMEDACVIVQHLNIGSLSVPNLFPQSFFGVFDGHGGSNASLYLSQSLHAAVAESLLSASPSLLKIFESETSDSRSIDLSSNAEKLKVMDSIVKDVLKTTYLKVDADFIAKSSSPQHGSTATTALILGNRIYCANVGDSRTILCRNFQPIALSTDHKPSREDEAKRIRDAGGFVINNRVMGELAVSRAFGDVEFKKGIQSIVEDDPDFNGNDSNDDVKNWDEPLLISEPDFETSFITKNDQFLLLACDGLFDVFTSEDIISFVKKEMSEHGDAQKCCQQLTNEAIRQRNSRDNVSVILIILNKWY
jgi:serine/threonine protein phosphatase PrpC/pSer/pThr/pTyr-binding forkhead associated (FHA) protein